MPKIDLKEAIDIFKWMNRGGIASLIPIGGVIGVMLLTRCGPVLHSTNYGDENLAGQITMQDHPEELVEDDHGHGHDDDHHDEHATEDGH